MKRAPFNIGQVVIFIGAIIAGLYFLRNILMPLIVAIVLTILVNALVRWIVRRWPAAPRWAVIALAGTIVSVALAGGMYVLADGAVNAIRRGPQLAARVDLLVESGGRLLGLAAPVHLDDLIGDLSIAKIAGSVLLSAQEAVTGLVLTIVYFGFMLASGAKVEPRIRNVAASSERAAAIHAGIARMEGHIETYIWVQTVTGLILALASGAVMMALASRTPCSGRSPCFSCPTFRHSASRSDRSSCCCSPWSNSRPDGRAWRTLPGFRPSRSSWAI